MDSSASRRKKRRPLAHTLLLAIAAGVAWLLWLPPWETLAILLLAPLCSFPLAMGLFPGLWIRRGEGLPGAAADLERRRPVWNVLSELYLDTDLDDRDNERIAAVLVDSGLSTGQLEEILYRELHPVLHANLLSVAGEWALFDLEWLEEQILLRVPCQLRFSVIPGMWMVRGEWAAVEEKLQMLYLRRAKAVHHGGRYCLGRPVIEDSSEAGSMRESGRPCRHEKED